MSWHRIAARLAPSLIPEPRKKSTASGQTYNACSAKPGRPVVVRADRMSENLDKEASKFDAAIAKLTSGAAGARTRKTPRKARAKKIISETDRRHLRATGRVEQWNIRCRE